MGQLAKRANLADDDTTGLVDVAFPAIQHQPFSPVFGLPDHIRDPAHQLRLIELPDRRKAARRSWLDLFITCSQKFNYSHNSFGFLSQAEAGLSILFVSSDDLRRLHAIIRELRAMLPSKGIVPVLSQSSPEISIGLLQRGADDVLHCEMDWREAIGRVHALQTRLRWREEKYRREVDKQNRFELELHALTRSRLTPKEQKVLVRLTRRPGRAVPYYALKDCGDFESLNCVKVVICNLRKKLAPGVAIRNESGFGYRIVGQRQLG